MENKTPKHFASSRNSGFTLMEILVVIIILGVLAGLAAPIFSQTKQKAYKAEAIQNLNAVRQSQIRYRFENTAYYEGTVNTDFAKLDFNPNDIQAGVAKNFDYTITLANTDANGFEVVATCNNANCGGNTVTYKINLAGTIS